MANEYLREEWDLETIEPWYHFNARRNKTISLTNFTELPYTAHLGNSPNKYECCSRPMVRGLLKPVSLWRSKHWVNLGMTTFAHWGEERVLYYCTNCNQLYRSTGYA